MNTAIKEFDVVVIGTGPGGLSAALSAARNGARVLLVEKNGYLGGNMAIGLPLLGYLDRDGKKVIGGIADEFMKDMAQYKTAYGTAASEHKICPMHNSVTLYDHELFKIVALRKVLKENIEVLFHTDVESVEVENARLKRSSCAARAGVFWSKPLCSLTLPAMATWPISRVQALKKVRRTQAFCSRPR